MSEELRIPKAGERLTVIGSVLRVHNFDPSTEPSTRSVEMQLADGQHLWTNYLNVAELNRDLEPATKSQRKPAEDKSVKGPAEDKETGGKNNKKKKGDQETK